MAHEKQRQCGKGKEWFELPSPVAGDGDRTYCDSYREPCKTVNTYVQCDKYDRQQVPGVNVERCPVCKYEPSTRPSISPAPRQGNASWDFTRGMYAPWRRPLNPAAISLMGAAPQIEEATAASSFQPVGGSMDPPPSATLLQSPASSLPDRNAVWSYRPASSLPDPGRPTPDSHLSNPVAADLPIEAATVASSFPQVGDSAEPTQAAGHLEAPASPPPGVNADRASPPADTVVSNRRRQFVIPNSQGDPRMMPAPRRRRLNPVAASVPTNAADGIDPFPLVGESVDPPSTMAHLAAPASPPPLSDLERVLSQQVAADVSVDSPGSIASPQASQGGHALPTLTDSAMGFQFRDMSRAHATDPALDDPTVRVMAEVRSCDTLTDLRAVIHPPDLFREFSDRRAVKDTTVRWLREIKADPRSHVEVGGDPSFALHLLVPTPFAKAITTKSIKEGWNPESLHQQLLINTGWLEHNATRIILTPMDEHARTTNIPGMNANDPSAGKTSLSEFAGRTCMQSTHNLDCIRQNSLIAHVDRRVSVRAEAHGACGTGGQMMCGIDGIASPWGWGAVVADLP